MLNWDEMHASEKVEVLNRALLLSGLDAVKMLNDHEQKVAEAQAALDAAKASK